MVDLALMSKLVDALKPDARLILLGDKNQLASVESGAVLADLTAALPANTLELKKSHRFNEHIKALSDAVNNQQDELAFEILQQNDSDTRFLDQDLINYITDKQKAWLKLMQSGAGFTEIYQSFNQFQVLCSNRTGKNSVADINHRVEQKLLELKLISPSSSWYAGRPIMVTQNNPALHLYNGDIGLCMPDSEQNGKLMVFFPDTSDGYKKHLPSRITSLETVYAMTIHKSQGSEFEEVLIVLPETINPLLSKELLYTAITRAKKTVKLFTEKSVFTATIRKKIERVTGLPLRF
jgi:exodeoxyribonuclease V alpha subunit